MTIDQILEKHLPDNGLCQRLKALNRARKEAIKRDLEGIMNSPEQLQPDFTRILLDEQQLDPVPPPPKPS
jgi:hypothetical protein